MDELFGVLAVLVILYALRDDGGSYPGGDVQVYPLVDPVWWSSSTASKYGIANEPPAHLMVNLARLRVALDSVFGEGGYTVTSGYRSPELNAKLGELGYAASPTSLHLQGRAADLAIHGLDVDSAADLARASGLFVEVIPYPDDGHVHVAIGA